MVTSTLFFPSPVKETMPLDLNDLKWDSTSVSGFLSGSKSISDGEAVLIRPVSFFLFVLLCFFFGLLYKQQLNAPAHGNKKQSRFLLTSCTFFQPSYVDFVFLSWTTFMPRETEAENMVLWVKVNRSAALMSDVTFCSFRWITTCFGKYFLNSSSKISSQGFDFIGLTPNVYQTFFFLGGKLYKYLVCRFPTILKCLLISLGDKFISVHHSFLHNFTVETVFCWQACTYFLIFAHTLL